MGSNDTTVNSGAFAGAIVTVAWWIASQQYGISPPPEVVGASMLISTAIVQRFWPRGKKPQ